MKTGFLLVVGLSVIACGCSKKPSVDAGAVAKVAMAKYPGRHFAPWDGSEGVVQMNAQLAQLKVPEVGISGRDKKYTVTVTFTSTSPENIAPRVFVSAYDLNGNQIGRWGVVTHMSEDLNPGITDRTADSISWETDTRPVLIAVDDDGTKPKATVAQAGVEPKQATGVRVVGKPGETFPEGHELVRGFEPAAGHLIAGTRVYIQGVVGEDRDPPKYDFTILDPDVTVLGKPGWMEVVRSDGKTTWVYRNTIGTSGFYWVRR